MYILADARMAPDHRTTLNTALNTIACAASKKLHTERSITRIYLDPQFTEIIVMSGSKLLGQCRPCLEHTKSTLRAHR
jgi:hypothetical protein